MTPDQAARELRSREPLGHREPRDADRTHLEAMMSPGMVWVGASGRQLTREEYVEFTWRRYASGHHGDDHTWEVTEFEVEELAPNLWAARYLLRQGERTTRRLTLWEHHDGLWRARYHQGTVMDSAP